MRLCDALSTGEEVEVDMERNVLTALATGQQFDLKPLGDVSASEHAFACGWVFPGVCWGGGGARQGRVPGKRG